MAAPQAPYVGAGEGRLELDEGVFGERFHRSLVHEAVRAELAARRRGTASTRTRAEIAMTGSKAWRQKGTGRARAGPLSTPQRTGGGVAFGPRPRDYAVKVNRKAHRRALRAALSVHAGRGAIAGVDPSAWEEPSTKRAVAALAPLRDDAFGSTLPGDGLGSVLLVLVDGEETCARSFRNIPEVTVARADDVGVADVISAARLLVSESALARLVERAVAR